MIRGPMNIGVGPFYIYLASDGTSWETYDINNGNGVLLTVSQYELQFPTNIPNGATAFYGGINTFYINYISHFDVGASPSVWFSQNSGQLGPPVAGTYSNIAWDKIIIWDYKRSLEYQYTPSLVEYNSSVLINSTLSYHHNYAYFVCIQQLQSNLI